LFVKIVNYTTDKLLTTYTTEKLLTTSYSLFAVLTCKILTFSNFYYLLQVSQAQFEFWKEKHHWSHSYDQEKDSRLHLHTYRYVIFLMGLKLRSLPTILCRRSVTRFKVWVVLFGTANPYISEILKLYYFKLELCRTCCFEQLHRTSCALNWCSLEFCSKNWWCWCCEIIYA
jgi:hypothetical protein